MAIPTIFVGCQHFGHGRLQALINCKGLEPAACVDLDLEGARRSIARLQGDVPADLSERVYPSITEAVRRHPAEACLIYATTTAHARLVVESLELGLHTLCVKPIATNQEEFREILRAWRARPELVLVQGQNKRWNPAAAQMRAWLREPDGVGEMLGGECRFWIRQNLWTGPNSRQPDAFVEGLYFHAGASHQLDQLVAAKGLPRYAIARVHARVEESLGQTGVWGTAGAQALLEYENGAVVSYTGTRAGHGNFFGWSGHWTFHGTAGDLRRDAGHLQLWRDGECVADLHLQDLHPGLVEDDRIQFDAFAEAIRTGTNREWIQGTLDTWVLMEACNVSAREQSPVDVWAFRQELFG